MIRLDIVVPVLNEAELVPEIANRLRELCSPDHRRAVVVDGGSTDGTEQAFRTAGLRVVQSPAGRATQMNHGAEALSGDVVVFLHADTRISDEALQDLERAVGEGAHWGRFDVHIEGRSRWLGLVEFMMNLRSRLSSIATGDQAIFVRRALFQRVGGYKEQPLMEDIELSLALRRLAPPACLRTRVTTSGRRWDDNGVWSTIWLMWRLRFAYWRGASAESLAALYA